MFEKLDPNVGGTKVSEMTGYELSNVVGSGMANANRNAKGVIGYGLLAFAIGTKVFFDVRERYEKRKEYRKQFDEWMKTHGDGQG